MLKGEGVAAMQDKVTPLRACNACCPAASAGLGKMQALHGVLLLGLLDACSQQAGSTPPCSVSFCTHTVVVCACNCHPGRESGGG